MYEIVFDPEAIDFLEKVPKEVAKRIWDKIMSTKENPHHFFERSAYPSDKSQIKFYKKK
jgi:mRNA-degrading endonuclease RelE of RelBE toxin-antitoxin system|tara:strand:+ start:783 stop:959 length:177 start_codon:yes stop_codon:yes gene_type:complete